jgi:hypothetical protein
MERERLIKVAPQYYACAVCAFFEHGGLTVASATTIWNGAGYNDRGKGGMKHVPLFYHTLGNLVTQGLLEAMPDDFGPMIYVRAEKFDEKWNAMKQEKGTAYYKWDIDPWPAAGSADTELGVLMEPEVCHGATEVYTRVQA